LARIILILQRINYITESSPNRQHCYGEMTSYITSSKMPFIDKDGHLTKVFQKEKHNTASQLLKEYANRNWSNR